MTNYKKHVNPVYMNISHSIFHNNLLNILYIYFHFHILNNYRVFNYMIHTYQHLILRHSCEGRIRFGMKSPRQKSSLHFLEIKQCSLSIYHPRCWVHKNNLSSWFCYILSSWDHEFLCNQSIAFDWIHQRSDSKNSILKYRDHIFGN